MNVKMHVGTMFECRTISTLLDYCCKKEKNWSIYEPVVDDIGIDLVVRTSAGHYTDIQVKGRTKRRYFTISDFTPRDYYWFVFYFWDKNSETENRYILSSYEVKQLLSKWGHIHLTPDMKEYKKRTYDCLETDGKIAK